MTPSPNQSDEILDRLRSAGESDDNALPLAETALHLGALDHPGLDLAPYVQHLNQLGEDSLEQYAALRRGMNEAEAAARALADTLSTKNGYVGDHETFDDPQNADLIRVIDRRRGLPVALGILYIHTAHKLGVTAQGLNTPGHFLLSVGEGEQSKIVDPFNGGVVLSPEELRPWPPAANAQAPEYGPVGRRDVLLRLLNNTRTRALTSKDMVRALTITERMVLIAPRRPELWLDLARANEGVGKLNGAIKAAKNCIGLSNSESSVGREAVFLLAALKRRLN